MNRIAQCFEQLKKNNRKALVGYVVSGDPYPEANLPIWNAMVEKGVDIIEVGVPFSDPMAEGPTIQLAHERALAHRTSLRSTLQAIKAFREGNKETPIVLMGYGNPVERMGYQAFAEEAAAAGVDGVITVDLPPEEAEELDAELKERNIANIFLLAPTTTEDRARQIVSMARGFLYYVSLKGVTGAGHLDVSSVNEKVGQFRQLTDLPICVGFGIKTGEAARAVCEHSDGAVVGSLLVDTIGKMADQKPEAIAAAVGDLVAPLRSALDS